MTVQAQLVTAARAYKRWVSPIGFLARAFVMRYGPTLPACEGTRLCLDIGAGTGPYEKTLRRYANVAPYIALDVAPCDDTTLIADCSKIPIKDGCIDLVVSFDVIQHVPNPGLMLDEACRVLKENGYLMLTFPFLYPECDARDFRRWTIEGMRAVLYRHGFEAVETQRRGGALFACTCWIAWAVQHLLPGQRKSWRAGRTRLDFVRAAVTSVITLPIQVLGWIALFIDAALPSGGMYMGACVLARKRCEFSVAEGRP